MCHQKLAGEGLASFPRLPEDALQRRSLASLAGPMGSDCKWPSLPRSLFLSSFSSPSLHVILFISFSPLFSFFFLPPFSSYSLGQLGLADLSAQLSVHHLRQCLQIKWKWSCPAGCLIFFIPHCNISFPTAAFQNKSTSSFSMKHPPCTCITTSYIIISALLGISVTHRDAVDKVQNIALTSTSVHLLD